MLFTFTHYTSSAFLVLISSFLIDIVSGFLFPPSTSNYAMMQYELIFEPKNQNLRKQKEI